MSRQYTQLDEDMIDVPILASCLANVLRELIQDLFSSQWVDVLERGDATVPRWESISGHANSVGFEGRDDRRGRVKNRGKITLLRECGCEDSVQQNQYSPRLVYFHGLPKYIMK